VSDGERRGSRYSTGRHAAADAPSNVFTADLFPGIPGRQNAAPVDIRFVSGSPTQTEIAAVTSVVTAAAVEQAQTRRPVEDDAPSSWERSRRPLRAPLSRGSAWGAWR